TQSKDRGCNGPSFACRTLVSAWLLTLSASNKTPKDRPSVSTSHSRTTSSVHRRGPKEVPAGPSDPSERWDPERQPASANQSKTRKILLLQKLRIEPQSTT